MMTRTELDEIRHDLAYGAYTEDDCPAREISVQLLDEVERLRMREAELEARINQLRGHRDFYNEEHLSTEAELAAALRSDLAPALAHAAEAEPAHGPDPRLRPGTTRQSKTTSAGPT